VTFSCGFKVFGSDLMLIIVGDAAEVACLLGPACGKHPHSFCDRDADDERFAVKNMMRATGAAAICRRRCLFGGQDI